MKILITERQLKLILETDDVEDKSIEDIQKELVYVHKKDIGKYGPKKDGVDGIMGPMTRKAYEEVYGKEYVGPTFSTDSEDINDKSIKNFHKIPLGDNNYRSAEPTADALKGVILKYGIKNVVRFNGDGGDSSGLSIKEEKRVCEENGCKFYIVIMVLIELVVMLVVGYIKRDGVTQKKYGTTLLNIMVGRE